MSIINFGKSAFRQSGHILWTILNMLVLFSLLLSSCSNPGASAPKAKVVSPTSTPNLSSPSNYQPPVFTHQEPRTAKSETPIVTAPFPSPEALAKDKADEMTKAGEKLKFDSEAKAQKVHADVTEIFTKGDQKMNSFKPVSNPVRKITPNSHQGTGTDTNVAPIYHSTFFPVVQMASALSILTSFFDNPSASNTFTVTTLSDTDDGACDSECSLREAIYAANDFAGPANIVFNVSGTLQLNDTLPYILNQAGLTIDGSGQKVTIIGGNSGQIMYIGKNVSVSLNGLFFSNGTIFNTGTLTVKNSSFENSNRKSASLTTVSYLVNNSSSDEEPGCTFYSEGSLSVDGANLTDDCIYAEGDLSISDSTLIRSSSVNHGTLSIANSIFIASSVWDTEELTITDSQFTDGYAMSEDAAVTITHSVFKSDGEVYPYSYVYSGDVLSVDNSTFDLLGGGSLFSVGTLNFMNNSSFTSNQVGTLISKVRVL